jgi:hypothetical protein
MPKNLKSILASEGLLSDSAVPKAATDRLWTDPRTFKNRLQAIAEQLEELMVDADGADDPDDMDDIRNGRRWFSKLDPVEAAFKQLKREIERF